MFRTPRSAPGIWRYRRRFCRKIGRIHNHVMKTPVIKRRRPCRDISLTHVKFDIISSGIFAGNLRVIAHNLHPRERKARHAPSQTQAGHTNATAQFQNLLPSLRRTGRRQQHRINARAIAGFGLRQTQPTAQKPIYGDLHYCPKSTSLSRITAVATK